MKFKGLVTVKIFDVDTPDQPRVVMEKENIITKRTVEQLFMSNAASFVDSLRIAITNVAYPAEDYEQTQITGVIAVGGLDAVTGRVFTPAAGGNDPFVTYQNSFLAPTHLPPNTSRDFITVGIVTGTTDNDVALQTYDAWAWVTYGSAFTQTQTEQIEITYKVFLGFDQAMNNFREQSQLGWQLLLLDEGSPFSYIENDLSRYLYSSNNPDYDLQTANVNDDEFPVTETLRVDKLKRECEVTVTFPTDRYISGLVFGRLEGKASQLEGFKASAQVARIPTASNIGTVFSHNALSDAVFDDPSGKATSDWQPVITETVATNDPTLLYSLLVDGSGGENVGSYLGYTTLYSGGDDSATWNQVPQIFIATTKYPYFVPEDDDIPYHNKWIYPWISDRFWISGNDTVIAIWEVSPQFVINASWDLGATQSVTKINDIAVDVGNFIYAATEEGLYQINTTTSAIVQLSSDRAMAVDVGLGGAVFAVLIDGGNVGRLASSVNATWGDAHPFSGTIVWENVLFIRIDPTDAQYKMGILELGFVAPNDVAGTLANQSNNAFGKIHWWDNVSNFVATLDLEVKTSAAMYFSRFTLFPYNSSFIVDVDPDTGDAVWVYPKYVVNTNLGASGIRGYPREVVKQIEALGTEVIDSDDQLVFTGTIAMPLRLTVGAALFNQEIRASSYVSTGSFTNNSFCYPSYALLEQDLAGGAINVCLGGYHGAASSNFGYNEISNLQQSAGMFEYAVSTTNSAATGFSAYKGELQYTYYFSPQNSGIVRDQLYALGGNVQKAQNGGVICFNDSSTGSINGGLAGGAKFTTTHFHPISISFWGAYNKNALYSYKGWGNRYAWNPTPGQWELDNDATFGGKPLHTAVEPFINGLSNNFQDLDLGAVNDLVLNEHYEFTRVPGEGLVADGTYLPQVIRFNYILRPVVDYNVVENIPAVSPFEITLAPASGDALWFGIDDSDSSLYVLLIGSTLATIIFTGSPAAGEILVQDADAGILEFNAADAGAAVTGQLTYFQKFHPTEL